MNKKMYIRASIVAVVCQTLYEVYKYTYVHNNYILPKLLYPTYALINNIIWESVVWLSLIWLTYIFIKLVKQELE